MINVLMSPHKDQYRSEESGIRRVVEAYFKYLPQFGVRLVKPGEPYDIKAAHAGIETDADVAHCHGLYWTADYQAAAWEWHVNADVIAGITHSKQVTVPSAWVAETFERDMRFSPHVVGHGIDVSEWDFPTEQGDYVLWNKNRAGDVCDPEPLLHLAKIFQRGHFVSTFMPHGREVPGHVSVVGAPIPHQEMKKLVRGCLVYLATTKETFGIGILEAMASGRPVLGYAHGGILDLVEHGVNGYLAKPGHLDDLAEGLDYCIKHAETLGANGREMAKRFTWEAACEKVARVYELALEPEPQTAAVIIPSYNYSGMVGRAIESAVDQDYQRLTDIIVVDDGSQDEGATEAVVNEWHAKDDRVRYVRQDNAGVAVARNRGISETDATYVCCLDADDKIAPNFLSTCIKPLEKDRSLGIAYTGLWYIQPNGKEGLSPWPTDCDYDAQLKGRNQIPTCCVFKRQMWERLGGYRARYCPHGAGEEDAEFWLRAGAYGWGGEEGHRRGPIHLLLAIGKG